MIYIRWAYKCRYSLILARQKICVFQPFSNRGTSAKLMIIWRNLNALNQGWATLFTRGPHWKQIWCPRASKEIVRLKVKVYFYSPQANLTIDEADVAKNKFWAKYNNSIGL